MVKYFKVPFKSEHGLSLTYLFDDIQKGIKAWCDYARSLGGTGNLWANDHWAIGGVSGFEFAKTQDATYWKKTRNAWGYWYPKSIKANNHYFEAIRKLPVIERQRVDELAGVLHATLSHVGLQRGKNCWLIASSHKPISDEEFEARFHFKNEMIEITASEYESLIPAKSNAQSKDS